MNRATSIRRRACTGIAIVLVATLASSVAAAERPSRFRMGRGVAFPGFGIDPYGGWPAASPHAPRFFGNPALLAELKPGYVRIMVAWHLLQPARVAVPPGEDPNDPERRYAALVRSLDGSDPIKELQAQVAAARWSADTRVFLVLMSEVPAFVTERDPVPPTPGNPRGAFPRDVSPTSEWALLLRYLIERFSGSVWGIEIMNEPNKVRVPNRNVVYDRVVGMIETAEQLRQGHDIRVLAPATEDGAHAWINYRTFTRQLLKRLDKRCDAGSCPRFLWSQHDYGDLNLRRRGIARANRVRDVVQMLACSTSRRRMPGKKNAGLRLYLTEGGVKIDQIRDAELDDDESQDDKQAEIVETMWRTLRNGDGGLSPTRRCQGRPPRRVTRPVELWTQYRIHDVCGDTEFQTGLTYQFEYHRQGTEECRLPAGGAPQVEPCTSQYSPAGDCRTGATGIPRPQCMNACLANPSAGPGARRVLFETFKRLR
jgi:hypothetical protein